MHNPVLKNTLNNFFRDFETLFAGFRYKIIHNSEIFIWSVELKENYDKFSLCGEFGWL